MKPSIWKLVTAGLLATQSCGLPAERMKTRTVITTDMESDDLSSLVRYLVYANEFDTEGIIYTSSRTHWSGDGNGTKFFSPGREYDTPQKFWRWTGLKVIQEKVLTAYKAAYPNLVLHAKGYPKPEQLQSAVKVGNIHFEGEMDHPTEGSDLIKNLLLAEDLQDHRNIYLQSWGGTNTIARAYKSIEEEYSSTKMWPELKERISAKGVILATGFQDNTYREYIVPHWPDVRVYNLSRADATWGYHCDGDQYGLPEDQKYFDGKWMKGHIPLGPLGRLYRTWHDGQKMLYDPLDVYGDPKRPSKGCKALSKHSFLSDGGAATINQLIRNGLQDPEHPGKGGWGGRLEQNEAIPSLWTLVYSETQSLANPVKIENFSTHRWIGAAQQDFAMRMKWASTNRYNNANHPPTAKIQNGNLVRAAPGSVVSLQGTTTDPDGDDMLTEWWQYLEEGTYPHYVEFEKPRQRHVKIRIPKKAQPGQTLVFIFQATERREDAFTRYDRVRIEVI